MGKLFVSHSSKDKKLVDAFVSNILQLGMHISHDSIFCTSSEGMGIKSGEDWRERIKDEIVDAGAIILLVTPNYKASEICLNEMGSAWIAGKKVIPLIFGEITYKSVGVIVEPKQITRGDSEKDLDCFCDCMVEILTDQCGKLEQAVWNSEKRKFLANLKTILQENPFPKIFSQQEMQDKITEYEKLQKSFDGLLDEKERLEQEIIQLKQCKDAREVESVEREFEDNSVLMRFRELLDCARMVLQAVSGTVRILIYNERYGQHLRVTPDGREELNAAIARQFVEERGDNFVPVYTKKTMSDICKKLDDLEHFLGNLSEAEFELLKRNYEVLNPRDLDFWQDVLGVLMPYWS